MWPAAGESQRVLPYSTLSRTISRPNSGTPEADKDFRR